mmetsp:Transcript_12752/g.27682  ORF Transcript_12752/g.27682 Transcript_12752/m.27682 type:complete len:525 (+) Transcript_12752:56-1630(+)|eukprot:CAMPEP_0172328618 /NCGR_PEP_ID=MMETSP1058-20130122/60444_1 /TAXON_ID=83371 /ORGANISM="Detonula confervacea, Strain CCMP 353" /LENGTH=524 /DNA_ID=CAMNT_0013045739 /DNA_START=431 /DNA_END=2005 /DNA_ORIENTATION=-
MAHRIPSRLIIVAGTYDGVLAGWDTVEHASKDGADQNDIDLKLLRRNADGQHLKLSFAMAAHEGSVRCLDVAGAGAVASKQQNNDNDDSTQQPEEQPLPGTLLSGGYDETINVFNLQKHNQVGELKTPSDLGSPLCCSFAPPSNNSTTSSAATPTHALVGLTSGKIILYKKRDWSVQHVLSGHDEGGVHCLAVHPTGRMALSGGRDGKIILWDLMKGRLAFVHKLPKKVKGRKETVNHIVWSDDGTRYAVCYGTKITARDVGSGEDLLDVDMPSRVNELAFIGGVEGMFVAAACDDGGLAVLEVGQLDDDDDDVDTRRAIMAIEPVDAVVAGDDRFKCIRSVEGGSGFLVVTANSGGVVSLMDLEGAARMMLTGGDGAAGKEAKDSDGESNDGSNSDDDDDNADEEEVEAAVEILDSVRIGSGARITDLAVWSYGGEPEDVDDISENESLGSEASPVDESEEEKEEEEEVVVQEPPSKRRGGFRKDDRNDTIELDAEQVEKARKLVGQAKKRQKKMKQKQTKES